MSDQENDQPKRARKPRARKGAPPKSKRANAAPNNANPVEQPIDEDGESWRTRPLPMWGEMFLRQYAETRSVSRAVKAAGITLQAAYQNRNTHRRFRELWDEITNTHNADLEASALTRAIEGTRRLELYQGRPVKIDDKPVFRREFETQLTLFLLRKRMPQKYADFGGDDSGGAEGIAADVRRALQESEDIFIQAPGATGTIVGASPAHTPTAVQPLENPPS